GTRIHAEAFLVPVGRLQRIGALALLAGANDLAEQSALEALGHLGSLGTLEVSATDGDAAKEAQRLPEVAGAVPRRFRTAQAALDRPDVRPAESAVQAQLPFLTDHGSVAVEQPAQPVQRAGQRHAGGVALGVRPQRVHQDVLSDLAATEGDQRLEQGQGLPLDLARESKGLVVSENLEAPEREDLERPRPRLDLRRVSWQEAPPANQVTRVLDLDARIERAGTQSSHHRWDPGVGVHVAAGPPQLHRLTEGGEGVRLPAAVEAHARPDQPGHELHVRTAQVPADPESLVELRGGLRRVTALVSDVRRQQQRHRGVEGPAGLPGQSEQLRPV